MALLLVFMLVLAPATALAAPGGAQTAEQLMQEQDKGITRGEFAMLLNACLSLPEGVGAGFSDVPENHPYAADISTAQGTGYMKGDGLGVFRPDALISGAEAAICISFFLGFDLTKVQPNSLTTVPTWAKPAVSNLLDLRMIALEMTDKKALTVADALNFITALATAMMFQGSPYSLAQVGEKDDFFGYNNRQYLATATIAPGNVFAMAFTDPESVVQNQISSLLAEILSTGSEPGSDAWKISELHKMYMDEPGRAKTREKIMPIIGEIKAVKNVAELNALAAKYYNTLKLQGFYDMIALSDAKADATKWCALIAPGSLLLDSRDYYGDDDALVPLHEAATNYLASILSYAGETNDLESRAAAVFAMEKGNALASMPIEQFANLDVIYNKSSWDEMDKITSGSNTLNYSPEAREALKGANVYCPDMTYIKHIESLYTEANLAVLKDFAIINAISTFGGYISDDFAELGKELQIVMLGAAVETASLELRAQMLVTNLMSTSFSKLYAEKYVTPSVKADVTQIVDLIRAKYRERIEAIDWMSDETKQMAIDKLNAIKAYVAYPDNYENIFNFDVKAKADGGNLIDFYIDYANALTALQLEILKKPFESNLWNNVPTYTVNAYYSPSENAIIIPAGILQEPFYQKDAKREANLGGLGAIIAHEFSHAFDNNGAQYDKNGTITNWWTESDYAAFGELTDKVAASLSKIKFVGEQTVNGILCTGETIADLGAMACVLDIADDTEGADMALAMRSWAGIWAARMSSEVAAYLLALDSHAPNKVRVNFVLTQLADFYKTFGVSPTDGMYAAPEERITIW
jgi:putative endopeptidase